MIIGVPLTSQMVAERVLTIARGPGPAGPAIAISGKSGLEAMEAYLRRAERERGGG